jgi:hypothetical protein
MPEVCCLYDTVRPLALSDFSARKTILAERVRFEDWAHERGYFLSNGKIIFANPKEAVEVALLWSASLVFEAV